MHNIEPIIKMDICPLTGHLSTLQIFVIFPVELAFMGHQILLMPVDLLFRNELVDK